MIGVNPIRTGYNAVADEWVGITPGTDGLFILWLIHELLKVGRIDLRYLSRYVNVLILLDAKIGLLMRDKNGVKSDLNDSSRIGGTTYHTVFHAMIEHHLDPQYEPKAVAEDVSIPAGKVRAIANELARVAFDEAIELNQKWTDFRGKTHAKMTGRPVSFHARHGISAHSNGFQTCRALHIL